jgi:hypothetical protein
MLKHTFIVRWQLAGRTLSLVELVLPMLNNNNLDILSAGTGDGTTVME